MCPITLSKSTEKVNFFYSSDSCDSSDNSEKKVLSQKMLSQTNFLVPNFFNQTKMLVTKNV